MADMFDLASEREEMDRTIALRVRKPEGPKPTGRCLWCDEPVEEGRRWCPRVECRDQWELKAKMAATA